MIPEQEPQTMTAPALNTAQVRELLTNALAHFHHGVSAETWGVAFDEWLFYEKSITLTPTHKEVTP